MKTVSSFLLKKEDTLSGLMVSNQRDGHINQRWSFLHTKQN